MILNLITDIRGHTRHLRDSEIASGAASGDERCIAAMHSGDNVVVEDGEPTAIVSFACGDGTPHIFSGRLPFPKFDDMFELSGAEFFARVAEWAGKQ